MNGYLVPANAKKGTLYFNMFRAFDLWLLGGGVGLTFILLGVFPSTNLVLTTIYLLPGIIVGILVFPIPILTLLIFSVPNFPRTDFMPL